MQILSLIESQPFSHATEQFLSGILDNYFELKRKVSKLGCQFGTRSRDQYSSIEGPYPKRHAIFYPGSWKTVTACAAYPFEPILQTLAQDLQTLTHLMIDEADTPELWLKLSDSCWLINTSSLDHLRYTLDWAMSRSEDPGVKRGAYLT